MGRDLGEQPECRAQSTQTDPHLVHTFRIDPLCDPGLVALDLRQAVADDDLESLLYG